MPNYPDTTDMESGDVVWPRHPAVRTIGGLQDWLQAPWLGDFTQAYKLLPTPWSFWNKLNGLPAPVRYPKAIDDLFLLLLARVGSIAQGIVNDPVEVREELFELLPFLRTDSDAAIYAGLYVGHVAMIEKSAGKLWVIESSYRANGLQIQPYDRWRDAREAMGAHVWHGRVLVNGKAPTKCMAKTMLEVAHRMRMQNRQYAIFDWGLNGQRALEEDDYVYCSEMVWRCANAIGVDLDARSPLERLLPFLGPRVLTISPCMDMRFNAGNMPY